MIAASPMKKAPESNAHLDVIKRINSIAYRVMATVMAIIVRDFRMPGSDKRPEIR